ncbi:MAG: hypothetical protein OXE99_02590 [Cellvibrionales bacterium]|nr:hypothetical protein [Cellvibrionales bacterium]
MRNNELRNSFPATAGIALADILANGVAVILLLIVVNLSVKQDKVQDLIETIEDVSLLLSRDFAQKVIHNALPTSAPAQLHDYEGSEIDRSPVFVRMPVLEVHKEGVRDYFSNTFWHRNELLKRENSLDQFLLSLSHEQLRRIRVDVYSIEPFYLFMSILKDHAITVRHWHFYGEDKLPKGIDRQALDMHEKTTAKGMETHVNKKGEDALPQGAELREMVVESKLDALMPSQSVHQDPLETPLSELKSTSARSASAQTRTQKLKLSLAKELQETQSQETDALPVNDFQNVIAFIFHLLITGSKKVDEGVFDYLTRLSLMDEMIQYIYQFPKLSPYRGFMVEKVSGLMNLTNADKPVSADLLIEKAYANTAGIKVPVNRAIDKIGVIHEGALEKRAYPVSFSLRLYPAAFEGVQLPLTPSSLVLVPLENQSQSSYQWQLIGVMDRVTLNTTVGFVYGKVADSQLHITSNENELQVGGQALKLSSIPDTMRHQRRLLWLYLLLCLLGSVLLIRWKR